MCRNVATNIFLTFLRNGLRQQGRRFCPAGSDEGNSCFRAVFEFYKKASGSKGDAFVRLAAMREIPVSERLLNFIRRPAAAREMILSGWCKGFCCIARCLMV
ncbi:hypothetical protein BW716_00300 [[Flexibacter] sp. ATCC 35208]|nr:hypothetical protein BW716_00300 [[Flexibacter] sp. ATCC 35208]